MTDLRTAAQQALGFVTSEAWGTTPYMDVRVYEDAARLRDVLQAALAASVPHGCHFELDPGMKPDGCVLDKSRPEDCIYAPLLLREGKDKTACEYWQPIEVTR